MDGFIRKFMSFRESEVKAREVSVFIIIDGRAARTDDGIDEVMRWKQERRTLRLMLPRNDLRFAVSIRYFIRAVGLSYFSRSLVGRFLLRQATMACLHTKLASQIPPIHYWKPFYNLKLITL